MNTLTFTDQMGREILVGYPPRRIISLVPSQTELLFDLGLDQQVVGITKFCIHPSERVSPVAKIGGTKKLNLQKIRELMPDLIIGNKEENDKDQIEELMKEFPVWMSDISILDDALEMISKIGALTGTDAKARLLNSRISEGFKSLEPVKNKLSVAYFIWKNPYMLAGRDTYIDDILQRVGFNNISKASRYPQITEEELKGLHPDVIFLSSEPYPFKGVHVKEFQRICPDAVTMVVDGEMFSWYGSRLLLVRDYLEMLVRKINSNY